MSQSEITYTEKVENGGVTATGLVAAEDLNQIKTVVNANGVDSETRLVAAESRIASTGWANFENTDYTEAEPLELNAGNGYTMILGMTAAVNTTQWPAGVALPFDVVTSKLVGTELNSDYLFRLNFKAQDGATSVLLDLYIDIGGVPGVILSRTNGVAKGANTETKISILDNYFTGSTFLSNGGDLILSTVDTSDDVSIWDIRLKITKIHKGI